MAKKRSKPTDPQWQRADLDEVIAVMRLKHGLDVSCCEESFLAKSLEKRRQATASSTPAAYLQRLLEDRGEAAGLSRSLRVTHSEFFRDPSVFAALEQWILPGLVDEKARNNRGEVRVWSAGCAAGQEAWSVAILLDEWTRGRAKPVSYRIFATDLSETDMALARAGAYSADALGNVRLRHLEGCFSRQGDLFLIAPRIRERVDFSIYDLLDEGTTCPPASIYGDFDIVLCCHVLLYYRPGAQRSILNKVQRCLAKGGHLVTGETERQIVERAGGFRSVAPGASAFQKVRGMKGG